MPGSLVVALVCLLRLSGLTEEEIAAEFPDGGYEQAVTDAANNVAFAEAMTTLAEQDAAASLEILTGGRDLSEGAMAELNRLLGL